MKKRNAHLVRSLEKDWIKEEVEDEKGKIKTVLTPITVSRIYACNSKEDAYEFIQEDSGVGRFYNLEYAGVRQQKI